MNRIYFERYGKPMKKRIYTVATSHLDTVWSWDFETTVSKYIYNTLVENFALFKKYPSYVFSFEGSYRYELMEEYYPELFEEMKKYIEQGKWNVTGSAFENGDVNCPSPEALFRNILIGNSYFDEKFGKRSVDIYLPDCFGFGWALPSIAYHSNLKGFTTQKLAWGSAYGVPFDIGKWYGVDGNYIYASCNPHDYYFTLTKLRDWDFVTNKLKENEKYGLDWTYMFHGIGDRGGAPQEATVKFVEDEIAKNPNDDIEVVAASADRIYHDIENELPQSVRDNLPEWKTELVMQNHGVGGYTSRAIGKRWNAKCQMLADVAERSGVIASYLGAQDYNEEIIEKGWKRTIAHQFHDDTPGTSCQRVYRRSWNDYALSINQLSGEAEASLCAVADNIDTSFCKGTPVVVYNNLEQTRNGVVTVNLKNIASRNVRIFDDNNKEIASQILSDENGVKTIIFNAKIKSLGFRMYDVRPYDKEKEYKSKLKATDNQLENSKYIVSLNKNGEISSIIDKTDDNRELLAKPIVLGLFNYTGSKDWPAWEMNFKQANKEHDRVPRVTSIKLLEKGPVRATVEIKQNDGKSEFVSYVSLTDGGELVEVYNEIEWQSLRTMCKNRFAFTCSNEKATFDLGLGAIKRENMNETLFEVPAQLWADITDKSGDFGVSVISECKHGWDKFSDNTLRLTVLHTPKKNYRIDSMQSMMDLGLNLYSYAVFSHKGEVGESTQFQARAFTTPLVAVATDKHKGEIKSDYSFVWQSESSVILRALKPSHHAKTDEIIVRFNEGENKDVKDFTFTLGDGIESARELWASEEYRGEARVENGSLVCDFKPYEVKTFGLTLKKSDADLKKCASTHIPLDYDDRKEKFNIPDNLFKNKITAFGTDFDIPKNAYMHANAQTLECQKGEKIRLLCAALGDDIDAEFIVDSKPIIKRVNSLTQAYARWDLYDFGETAYIKDGHLGWEFTHCLDENGEVQYAKSLYFWVLTFDSSVTLPKNDNIIVLAASVVSASNSSLVTRLYDKIENNRPFTFTMSLKEKLQYFNSKLVWNLNDKDNFITHWNNGKNGKRVEQTGKRAKTRTIKTVGH